MRRSRRSGLGRTSLRPLIRRNERRHAWLGSCRYRASQTSTCAAPALTVRARLEPDLRAPGWIKPLVVVAGAMLAVASCARGSANESTGSLTPSPIVSGSERGPVMELGAASTTTAGQPAPTALQPASPTPTVGPTLPAVTAHTAAPGATTVVPMSDAQPPAAATSGASPGTSPRYRFPLEDVEAASYAREHHDYPAADIFAACGAAVVSPVDGTLVEVRRDNQWDPSVDNPATRGGRSATIVGVDGVRYYFAHLHEVAPLLEAGQPVSIGTLLGTMGETGRASACHLHFGVSPPCPGKEWSVRRGVIEPWDYLDAWRTGEQLSPDETVRHWQQVNPDACATAMAEPHAAES